MSWKKFAETEKGIVGQVECESHVYGFFDIKNVVHHKFLHQGQTVNRWYYLEVLKWLRKMSGEKDLSCGETTPGSSIMTMHQLMHHY
jgi:hypothetical protein